MKKNDKLSQLAAMMDRVIEDDPHESKKASPKKQKAKVQTGQGSLTPEKPKAGKASVPGPRERTAVNLTPGAVEALKQIQAFLITDCGAKSVSTSAAMCIALETTAELLGEKKAELGALYQKLRNSDGRRKQVA